MTTAIFGISNNGLNLVVNLLILMLVVVWLALIVYTYLDAKRRISDPFLVGCATLASFIPYLGTAVYAIVRPPEFLEDAHERELEIKAAELRVRQLTESSCPGCEYPIEKNFLRCPKCQRRLKDPCPSCRRPVDPRWSLCPYCEEPLHEGERPRRKRAEPRKQPREEAKAPPPQRRKQQPAVRKEPQEQSKPKRPQRSPNREPDPDPRQA
jgi:Double zinc ribbon